MYFTLAWFDRYLERARSRRFTRGDESAQSADAPRATNSHHFRRLRRPLIDGIGHWTQPRKKNMPYMIENARRRPSLVPLQLELGFGYLQLR